MRDDERNTPPHHPLPQPGELAAADVEQQMVDFYNGLHVLEVVRAWSYAAANRATVLDQLAAFERAYERLVALQAAGLVDAGDVAFTSEKLGVVRRLRHLVGIALAAGETCAQAEEIHRLAERSLEGMVKR